MSDSSKTSTNPPRRRPSRLNRVAEPGDPPWLAYTYERSCACVCGEIHKEFISVDNARTRVTADDVKAPDHRLRGEGYTRGTTVVGRGTRITPHVQALLTAAGVLTVPVYERPRVGVVLSSHDAVPPADVEHAWQRPDSMSAYVRSLFARWGYLTPSVEQLPTLRRMDSQSAANEGRKAYIKCLFELMSRYDLLIGVGMPADSSILSDGLGAASSCFREGYEHVHFDNTRERGFICGLGDHRTRPIVLYRRLFRPGTLSRYCGSDGFTYYDRAVVLNIPGHTAEVATIMHVFVRRILDSMEGLAQPQPVWRTGTLASPITRHSLEHRYLWGIAHTDKTGHVVIQVSNDQNSLSLNTFATSNALVAIHSGAGQVTPGERVDYLSLE